MKTQHLLILILVCFSAMSHAQQRNSVNTGASNTEQPQHKIIYNASASEGRLTNQMPSTPVFERGDQCSPAAYNTVKHEEAALHTAAVQPVMSGGNEKADNGGVHDTPALYKEPVDKNPDGAMPQEGQITVVKNNPPAVSTNFQHGKLIPGLCYDRHLRICRIHGFKGLYGVRVGLYKDLSQCRKDMKRIQKRYKMFACIIEDGTANEYRFHLIMGRTVNFNSALRLLLKLWRYFPGCNVVKYHQWPDEDDFRNCSNFFAASSKGFHATRGCRKIYF